METLWQEALDQVKDLTLKPEVFLYPSACDSQFNKSKVITKVLYDATKVIENESRPDNIKGKLSSSYLTTGGPTSLKFLSRKIPRSASNIFI